MGGTTNVEVKKDAAVVDLHTEVPLAELKLPPEQTTPEAKAQVAKFYTEQIIPIPTGDATSEKQGYYQGGDPKARAIEPGEEALGKSEKLVGTPKLPEAEREISYADFQKIDIRVGEITAVDGIPGADKLFKLQVNFGELGPRTIAAGIREGYDSLEQAQQMLVGGRYAFVVNLAPRKLKGVESQGMLLATHTETNKALLIDCKDHVIGARLG